MSQDSINDVLVTRLAQRQGPEFAARLREMKEALARTRGIGSPIQ